MAGESGNPGKGFAARRNPSALNELDGFRAPVRDPERERETERELLDAARGGDARALERVVRRLADSAFRYGQTFCRDPHDAEDVSQDVLAALVRTLPSFRGESSLSTWAWTVARRACVRHRRQGRRTQPIERPGDEPDLELPDPGPGPEGDAERRELGVAIEAAIATLPVSQREVLVLRDVEGLSAARVARRLGLQVHAVKSRLHRARLGLRRSLAAHASAEPTPRRRGCPDTALLVSRYLEGQVGPDLCARLEAHVSGCPDCAAECVELRRMLGACRRWGSAPAPRVLRQRLRAMMRAATPAPPARPGRGRAGAPRRAGTDSRLPAPGSGAAAARPRSGIRTRA